MFMGFLCLFVALELMKTVTRATQRKSWDQNISALLKLSLATHIPIVMNQHEQVIYERQIASSPSSPTIESGPTFGPDHRKCLIFKAQTPQMPMPSSVNPEKLIRDVGGSTGRHCENKRSTTAAYSGVGQALCLSYQMKRKRSSTTIISVAMLEKPTFAVAYA